VYEFYEKNSSLCKAMDKPFEKLATQYKGRADFCKLDVDNFEVHATQAAQPSIAIHART
jgi:thioredoxin 1